MIRKVVDLVLVALIVAGGYLAWQASRERRGLRAEYDRLVRAAGELPVTDPTMVYVRALDTGDPMHYAWRVYLPPNYPYEVRHSGWGGGGESSNSGGSAAQEFIARVRFRPDDQGRLHCYLKFAGGASRGSIGTPEVGTLLRRRWSALHVEALGSSGAAVIDPKKPATLFRLTLPPELQSELKAMWGGEGPGHPDLINLRFGPPGSVKDLTPTGEPLGER